MITLITKNGARTGNAIIYGGIDVHHPIRVAEWLAEDAPEVKPLFFVETDFGNHMKLTWREIEEMFTIGKVMDYRQWRYERAFLISQTNLVDQIAEEENTTQT